MMNVSANEIIGKEFRDIWPEDMQPIVDESIRKVLEGKQNYFDAYRMNGAEKGWWSVSLTPSFDSKGEVDRLIAISTDITQRKQAEERWLHLIEVFSLLLTTLMKLFMSQI